GGHGKDGDRSQQQRRDEQRQPDVQRLVGEPSGHRVPMSRQEGGCADGFERVAEILSETEGGSHYDGSSPQQFGAPPGRCARLVPPQTEGVASGSSVAASTAAAFVPRGLCFSSPARASARRKRSAPSRVFTAITASRIVPMSPPAAGYTCPATVT